MKTKRVIWTICFLSVTLAAIVMEVIAGIFHPAGTIPWTEYLARYVPWPIQLAAYVALAVWLPFHFWRHDHLRKIEYDRGVRMGRRLSSSEAYDNGRMAGWHEGRAGKPMPSKPGGPVRAIKMAPPPGWPHCSHGYPFGYNPEQHQCGELPSDAQG